MWTAIHAVLVFFAWIGPARGEPAEDAEVLVQQGIELRRSGRVAQLVSNAAASVYDDDNRCLFGDLTRDERCGSWRDRAEAAQALAIAGYVLGGAGLATSAVLLWSSGRRPPHAGSMECAPLGPAFVCRGEF